MNCEIGRMIKQDICWTGFMTTLFIFLGFLEHLGGLIPASLFYIQFWEAIGDHRQHERWHSES